jgi:radical SAM superfamily enzyme with C-terminal helix-hairpin-helix motif
VQQRVRERCNAEVATASEKPRGPGCSGEQQTQGCERERRDQQLRGEVVVGTLTDEQRSTLFGRLFLPLDLNSASRDEIMLIPGMTARMAHEFEEYRPYTSLEQFRREIGKYVDANEVARLEQYVFVPLDLNSASREAIMTIPGMTARMAHEFEEYRPYTSLEQFRREIGKYVDANEVARLERYVTIAE